MHRFSLTVSIGIVFYLIPADCSQSATSLSPGGANNRKENNKFCVTIWPRSTRVHFGDRFKVILRVVNATDNCQTFVEMSRSWNEQWELDNPRIRLVGYGTADFHNSPLMVRLEPGEAYERTVEMQIDAGDPLVTTSFKIGFTPARRNKHTYLWENGSQTYWSNMVVLGIKTEEKRVEKKKGEEKKEKRVP